MPSLPRTSPGSRARPGAIRRSPGTAGSSSTSSTRLAAPGSASAPDWPRASRLPRRRAAGARGRWCPCPASLSTRSCRRDCCDDAVDRREAEAGPLPDRLGGEEGLEERGGASRRPCPTPVSVTDEHRRSRRRAGPRARPRRRGRARRRRVSTISAPPPSGIASRALTTRFMTTCSIWPGRRARARIGPDASDSSSSMCSPMSRRSISVELGDERVQVEDRAARAPGGG